MKQLSHNLFRKRRFIKAPSTNIRHYTERNYYSDGSPLHGMTRDTEIIFKDHETGKILNILRNKVIISGAQFTACKHFDLPQLVNFPTYNYSLNLDNSVSSTSLNTPKICLFGCGTDGCGIDGSEIYPVDYTKRIHPSALVPFRYQLSNIDLDSSLRQKYFGRKVIGDRIAYYFKAFENEPELHIRYVDGTLIDNTIYDNTYNREAETFIECKLQITKEDFRDYFFATTGINTARINSLSLLSAWYTEEDGFKWYQDIIPITQLNISNEYFSDLTKGIDILYHIFY